MRQRSAEILEAVIERFINTGEPVSSAVLYESHDFGIKPAMIRLELEALEEDGFLKQPHHSAGRIPTDRGYEFFAERALEFQSARIDGDMKNLFEQRAWRNLLSEFSSELKLLGVIADFANNVVYKTGLESLVENLDWENRNEITAVIRDFEGMDECLLQSTKNGKDIPCSLEQSELKVFIGKKSPVTKSDNLSVIEGNYMVLGGIVSIFAIGPKRMDYKKTIRMFRDF